MKAYKTYSFSLIFCFFGLFTFTQNNNLSNVQEGGIFTIRGTVYEQGSRDPIEAVDVLLNNGSYTKTDTYGKFTIQAKLGDELTVTHHSFETVFYTIKSGERINIQVSSDTSSNLRQTQKSRITERFNQMIDSADVYLKKNAEKSIKFIGDALDVDITARQSAEAHELLGDVYAHWKQFDLAISAYKISIENEQSTSAKLKLARAYLNNEDFKKSISTYQSLKAKDLSNYEKVLRYEGLGDSNTKGNNLTEAIEAYQEGLVVAKKHAIMLKITDLNSKIAQAYNQQGDKISAKKYFNSSLDLAEQTSKKRAVEEKIKVAEFNSDNEDYESEITLRKEALKDIETIERDSVIANESAITLQKQNYKIGNAYFIQNDLIRAIPYFEKSIEEADKKRDLLVQKDATRKLSEALLRKGDTQEGLAMMDSYKTIVDELYAKKEQELSQVARFSRNLAEQQNRIRSLESDRALSQSKYDLTQERNKRQELIIYSLIGGLVLFLIMGYLMFKYIKQQRLANNLLALKSLRSQMNPHFIFNALNSVNSFIAINDERTANKYLSDFSKLMRSVLENSEEDFIPLQKEIKLLELYTKLEHFRFQDKFEYAIEVNEAIDVEDYQIPPMLLQPYIENAVWHGLRYKSEKGHLNISIQPRFENQITITITDNGIGRTRSKALKTEHQKKQNSKGMNNIKKRVVILNEMYKDKVDVSIADYQLEAEDTGTKVVVTLKKD